MRRLSGRLSDFVVGVQREISTEIGKQLVPDTPVLTGLARNNWVPGINAAPINTTTGVDPNAVAAPARIAAAARFLRLGDTFYITNNLDYIKLLDEGYSPQAAAGFVRRAIGASIAPGVKKAVRDFRSRAR